MSEDRELSELCNTFLYSGSAGADKKNAQRYIKEKAGHPDEGSAFAKQLGPLKYLFRVPGANGLVTSAALWYLTKRNYDSLLLELAERIIGHTAFQIHKDNSLHVFSVEVVPEYRERGLAQYMVERVLDEAKNKGIQRMRIGGGKNDATNKIHQNLAEKANELGIIAQEGNWVSLV